MLHIAIKDDRTQFIKKTLNFLRSQPQVMHELMLHQTTNLGENPLHMAASKGNLEVVKLFLDICSNKQISSSLPRRTTQQPWLQVNIYNENPCHFAVRCLEEECALEILDMDINYLSNAVDMHENGLLFSAIDYGLYKVANKILTSSSSFISTGPQSLSALHIYPIQSDEEDLFRLLLEKKPSQLEHTNVNGESTLFFWARRGKVWPFVYIKEKCNDIIPDIRKRVVSLMSKCEMWSGGNLFHALASYAPKQEDAVAIMKILIQIYREEVAHDEPAAAQVVLPPWLTKDLQGSTPLIICLGVNRKYEDLAILIWSEEKKAFMEDTCNILLDAISTGCKKVAKEILDSVDTNRWTELKGIYNQNALHAAPYCSREILETLVKKNPRLLEGTASKGRTILHYWAGIGHLWPFEYILQKSVPNHPKWKTKLLSLLSKQDEEGYNVFHYAVFNKKDTTIEILQILVNAYKTFVPHWTLYQSPSMLPWLQLSSFGTGSGTLHDAIKNKHEDVALEILSLSKGVNYHHLLDYYGPNRRTLFLAMECNCYKVARIILDNLSKQHWRPYLMDPSDGKNILHHVPTCTDEEFGKWLVEQAPELVVIQDMNKKTPLDIACEKSANWIIQVMVQTNPELIFEEAPLAWSSLCENGNTSALYEYIQSCPGNFREHCVKHKASPLHYIDGLPDITSYKSFLNHPHIKNLVDITTSSGEPPLFIAIKYRNNKNLTKALLDIDDAALDTRNNADETARSLLEKLSEEDDDEWKMICQDYGVNHTVRLKDLLEARNTFSVVAALLATITFTAGFTVPGGFNQDKGYAILTKTAAFLVFLVFDTIALCSSMLVLTCLIWSIIYDLRKAKFLIDRSMKLLMVSLYSTMIAFICGVFAVTFPKSKPAAIVVIVICSLLGISLKRSLLYKKLWGT